MIRRIVLCALLFAACFCRAQTVICFGDSLTAGYGAPHGSAYPDFLERDLQVAGYTVSVVNEGVAGDTAEQALQRLGPVLQAHPAVVVLELGANDALDNRPLPAIAHDLRAMMDAFERARIPVVVAGMDARPYLGLGMPPKLRTPEMQQFYALDGRLARQYRAPLIPFLLRGVYGDPALMSGDWMHPNGAGYEKVAETVLPFVEAALKRDAKQRR